MARAPGVSLGLQEGLSEPALEISLPRGGEEWEGPSPTRRAFAGAPLSPVWA